MEGPPPRPMPCPPSHFLALRRTPARSSSCGAGAELPAHRLPRKWTPPPGWVLWCAGPLPVSFGWGKPALGPAGDLYWFMYHERAQLALRWCRDVRDVGSQRWQILQAVHTGQASGQPCAGSDSCLRVRVCFRSHTVLAAPDHTRANRPHVSMHCARTKIHLTPA